MGETNREEQIEKRKKEKYFGSVRFFKNMILLAVIIMIAIPTGLTIYLTQNLHESEAYIEDLLERYNILSEDKGWYKLNAESPYENLYPDFYAPQALPEKYTREDGVIYLTFDDGPSKNTEKILDVLKAKNAKATFFVVKTEGAANEALLRRIVEEGHTLAMHTYSHNYTKIYASVEDYLADMNELFTYIQKVTGETPTLFRFPGGSINGYNSGIYQELIAEMLRRGFIPYDWNISSGDAATNKPLPAQTLASNVVAGAQKSGYGIVLLHDSSAKTTTAEAVAPMIDQLQNMGFELRGLTPEVKPVLFPYK